MSLRGALKFVRRQHAHANIEARADDLTGAALAQDVSDARGRVEKFRHLLERAERELAQRRWELETYALQGVAPKRKGLARRVAERARDLKRQALGPKG